MTNPFWKEGGGFIPFRFPVDQPSDAILDEPLWTVSFNIGWRGLVLGACGALARPETYKTDDPYVAEGAALEGMELLERIASGVECGEVVPSYDPWICDYSLTSSPSGWELLYETEGRWGEWVSGIGFRATTSYNSDLGLYIKRLAVRLDLGAVRWIRGIGVAYDTEVDFAPGGDAYRHSYFWSLIDANLVKQLEVIHGSSAYNASVYDVNPVRGYQMNRLLFNCYCGADVSPSTLDNQSFVLKSVGLYGWSGDSPCS